MDTSTAIGLLAIVGVMLMCYVAHRAQRAWRGGERGERELDARYGKARNQRTED